MHKQLKISILTENLPGDKTHWEHGLSYLIEYDNYKILFDTGQSDLFLRNAEIMGISLNNIDKIVLSHGHYDHGNGLNYINGGTLITHPHSFKKRYRKEGKSYIGLKNGMEWHQEQFNLITTTEPYPISDKITFLGQIPRITEFESQTTNFVFEDDTPDFVLDDSALAIEMDKGVFVITGCGHAGIVNSLLHARVVTQKDKILGIMGGFHLKHNDEVTQKTIQFLKSNRVDWVYPSHCTKEPALNEFHKNFKSRKVKTGEVFIF